MQPHAVQLGRLVLAQHICNLVDHEPFNAFIIENSFGATADGTAIANRVVSLISQNPSALSLHLHLLQDYVSMTCAGFARPCCLNDANWHGPSLRLLKATCVATTDIGATMTFDLQ